MKKTNVENKTHRKKATRKKENQKSEKREPAQGTPEDPQHGTGTWLALGPINPQHLDPARPTSPQTRQGPIQLETTTGLTAIERPMQTNTVITGATNKKQVPTDTMTEQETLGQKVFSPARPEVGKPAPHPLTQTRRNSPAEKEQKQRSKQQPSENGHN